MDLEDIKPGQIYRLTTGAADVTVFNDPRTWGDPFPTSPPAPIIHAYDEFMIIEVMLLESIYYAYVFIVGKDIAGYIKIKRAIENYKIYADDLDDWELVL